MTNDRRLPSSSKLGTVQTLIFPLTVLIFALLGLWFTESLLGFALPEWHERLISWSEERPLRLAALSNILFAVFLSILGIVWWRIGRLQRTLYTYARQQHKTHDDIDDRLARYDIEDRFRLEDLAEQVQNLTRFNPDRPIVLAAQSGSGKTTALRLILRQMHRPRYATGRRIAVQIDLADVVHQMENPDPRKTLARIREVAISEFKSANASSDQAIRLWKLLRSERRLILVLDSIDQWVRVVEREVSVPTRTSEIIEDLLDTLISAGLTLVATADDSEFLSSRNVIVLPIPRPSVASLVRYAVEDIESDCDAELSTAMLTILSDGPLNHPGFARVLRRLPGSEIVHLANVPELSRPSYLVESWLKSFDSTQDVSEDSEHSALSHFLFSFGTHVFRTGVDIVSPNEAAQWVPTGSTVRTVTLKGVAEEVLERTQSGGLRLRARIMAPLLAAHSPNPLDVQHLHHKRHLTPRELVLFSATTDAKNGKTWSEIVGEASPGEDGHRHTNSSPETATRLRMLRLSLAFGAGLQESTEASEAKQHATTAARSSVSSVTKRGYMSSLAFLGPLGTYELWQYAIFEPNTNLRIEAGEYLRTASSISDECMSEIRLAVAEAQSELASDPNSRLTDAKLRRLGISAWLLPTWAIQKDWHQSSESLMALKASFRVSESSGVNPLRLEVSLARGIRLAFSAVVADHPNRMGQVSVESLSDILRIVLDYRWIDWHADLMVRQGVHALLESTILDARSTRLCKMFLEVRTGFPLVQEWQSLALAAKQRGLDLNHYTWMSESVAARDFRGLHPEVREVLAEMIVLRKFLYSEGRTFDQPRNAADARRLLLVGRRPLCIERPTTSKTNLRSIKTKCPRQCPYSDFQLCPMPSPDQGIGVGAELDRDLIHSLRSSVRLFPCGRRRRKRRLWAAVDRHYAPDALKDGTTGSILEATGAREMIGFGLLARLCFNALPFLLLLSLLSTSVTHAGVVAGAFSIGGFVGGLLQGWLIDRTSAKLTALTTSSLHMGASLWMLLSLESPITTLATAAVAAGMTRPFVATILRAWWQSVFHGGDPLQRAMSLESILGQIGDMGAAPVAVVLLLVVDTRIALAACSLIGAIATLRIGLQIHRGKRGADSNQSSGASTSGHAVITLIAAFGISQMSLGSLDVFVPSQAARPESALGTTLFLIGLGILLGSGFAMRVGDRVVRPTTAALYGLASIAALFIGLDPGSGVSFFFALLLGALLAVPSIRTFVAAATSGPSMAGRTVALVGSMYFLGPGLGRPLAAWAIMVLPSHLVGLLPFLLLGLASMLVLSDRGSLPADPRRQRLLRRTSALGRSAV